MDNAHVHYSLINSINNSKNDILVVFDASAYGSFYYMLKEVLGDNPSIRVSILPWESYEHYLLGCFPFNLNLTKESVGCSYASLEQLAEEHLHEITGYQKDRPLICFNGCSCCTRKCIYRNHKINFINYPLTLLTAADMNLFE